MEIIKLDIKINVDDIDQNEIIYHADLIKDNKDGIYLKLFYDDSTDPGYILNDLIDEYFLFEDFDKYIEVSKIHSPQKVREVDFSSSNLLKVTTQDNFPEEKSYTMLKLSELRVIYNPLITTEYNEGIYGCEFYLIESASKLIRHSYSFRGFTKKPNIWEAYNRHEEFHNFGEIEFKFDYFFYSRHNDQTDIAIIYHEPRLNIRHKNLEEAKLIEYGQFLCSVASFYWHTNIDFNLARVYKKEYTAVITIPSEEIFKPGSPRLKLMGVAGEVFDLIKKITLHNTNKWNFFRRIAEKYILAMNLTGESRFMILYNIIEQIRNEYISSKDIEQEYNFTESKNKTDKFIKEKLKEIADIIKEDQKELFKTKVIGHVKTLKYLPMTDQFKNLFIYFDLNLEEFGINFNELKKLRDTIFHGHSISIDNSELIEANEQLPELISTLMLKILGVK